MKTSPKASRCPYDCDVGPCLSRRCSRAKRGNSVRHLLRRGTVRGAEEIDGQWIALEVSARLVNFLHAVLMAA